MISRDSILRILLATLPTVLLNFPLRADELNLRLDVEGYINTPPTWRNENDEVIDHLTFKFSHLASLKDMHLDVDSDLQKAKLVIDRRKEHVSVTLMRPKRCFIGSDSIDDSHVHLVHGLHEHPGDGIVEFKEDTIQDFKIRFSGRGGYSQYSGSVKCETPGNLRYSYH